MSKYKIETNIPEKYNLTGKTFGRWTVLNYSYTYHERMWLCQCECGTIKDVSANSLKNGKSKSCGCYAIEVARQKIIQFNTNKPKYVREKTERCSVCGVLETETPRFYLTSEYGNNLCNKHYLQLRKRGKILHSTRLDDTEVRIKDNYAEVAIRNTYGDEIATALIDINNIDLISQHKWHLSHGYAKCKNNDISISMHELIMGVKNGYMLDHINGNRLDNRKKNLRHVTPSQNSKNRGFQSNNKSGVVGVTWRNDKQKWYSIIAKNGKSHTRTFYDVLDAMKYRFLCEVSLFKEHRRMCNWDDIWKSNFIICIINNSNIENNAISDYLISNLKEHTELLNNTNNKKVMKYDCIKFIDQQDLSKFYSEFGYRVISIYIGNRNTEDIDKLNKNIKLIIGFVTFINKNEDCVDIVEFIENRKKEMMIFSELKGVDNIEELQLHSSFAGQVCEW